MLHHFLTYAGTIPFVAFTLCYAIQPEIAVAIFSAGIITYSLIIFVFVIGSHWGIALNMENGKRYLILSTILVIFLWLAAWANIVLKLSTVMASLSLLYMMLLGIDFSIYKNQGIQYDYFKMRVIATCIVCTSLIANVFLTIY